MNDLEMIKAFAELEGVTLWDTRHKGEKYLTTNEGDIYNPITDLALTMKAVINYNVQIKHSAVCKGKIIFAIRGTVDVVSIFCESQFTRGIIGCILKSEGLYK